MSEPAAPPTTAKRPGSPLSADDNPTASKRARETKDEASSEPQPTATAPTTVVDGEAKAENEEETPATDGKATTNGNGKKMDDVPMDG